MLAVYHKSFAAHAPCLALHYFAGDSRIVQQLADDNQSGLDFFLFICRFPSLEDEPGGIYLSGQSSNPVSHRYLRIDPSTGIGGSFPKFRTCRVG